MPDNVMTNILDRLPIQDAVKTGILSRDWRFKWTLLTQLVFDDKFFQNLPNKYDVKNLSRLLLHLKGPIKKFDLYMPYNEIILDVEDVNHWILFLSRKGIEELTLSNMPEIPHNFCGFPNLLSLDLFDVEFKVYTCREFIAGCPLLETLIITGDDTVDTPMITSSNIFQHTALPKLQELDLEFRYCQFLAEDDVVKVPLTFYSLKTLTLFPIDFSSDIMLSCVSKMICNSPILRNLNITVDSDCNKMGMLHLQSVVFSCCNGSETELCFMKSLLACSPHVKEDCLLKPVSSSFSSNDNGKVENLL
ncbi:F-box/FBD/LRR-repeat protein-like protein [Tanacetum coccineum]